MNFDLVIFDCDGVLVDSELIANRVFARQLGSIGVSMSVEQVMEKFVVRTREACLALAAEISGRELPSGFAQAWDSALYQALAEEVRPVEGVRELISQLNIPFCVASNGSRARMEVSLRSSGLLPFFEGRQFSSADVEKPKPAPDLFLHAARSMGAAPSRCLVVEDTPTGVRAGVGAGMRVYGYAGGAHANPSALRAQGAIVFEDMKLLALLL